MRYKNWAKLVFLVVFTVLSALLFALPVSAHQSGCHRWHSCPSDSGSYVCGDTGYTSQCGTMSEPTYIPESAPTPRQPVITSRTITANETIPFKTMIKKTNKEYTGYKRTEKEGVTGVKQLYTEIKYTDGVESSRDVVKGEVIKNPEDMVIINGSRKRPEAKITSVKKIKDSNKFNITGSAKKNSEAVLAVEGKRIKRAKVNNKGSFTFEGVKLSSAKSKVEIYNRAGGKEKLISEKTSVNNSSGRYTTEYQQKIQ